VGFLAALSLLPYVSLLAQEQDYMALFKTGFQLDRVWGSLEFALGSALNWPLWVWFALAPLVFGVAWEVLSERALNKPVGYADLPRFGVSALVAGIALYFVFLRLSEFPIQPRHFLPLMVFTATAIEVALAHWCRKVAFWSPVFAAVIVCAMFPTTLRLAKYRQTKMDLIAAELDRCAKPGDFIVVCECYCGISFARYLKANIPWTTLPPLDDYRFHRTDLLKKRLCSKPPAKECIGAGCPHAGRRPHALGGRHLVTAGAWRDRAARFAA
jgi:hypothetical protein